ncbi:hypothetical protein CAP36_00660 [Chitinophagaceae bacterium IBVUCB2]|nr:hypothetical protein CAP36_00660 [Chitinophagaceae bacterium IBVUCB2]
MADTDENFILISDQNQLDTLIDRFFRGQVFADQFKFSDRSFFINLLESLKINHDDFTKRYFYYDDSRKLHISESEFGYVWISTTGLVARDKPTTNSAVNSCLSQYTVVSLLLNKAIEVSQKEDIYDIDSYNFGYLSELAPALYHNIIFYIEVLCKAYLSLNGITPPRTHKLSSIYQKTVETMAAKKHNDSLFQAQILYPLYKFVDHINKLPRNFKEQFVKYDDNPGDSTVILFQTEPLIEVSIIFELANDFIHDFFYTGKESFYIKSGLYQRLLDKADTDEKKQKIKDMYGHFTQGD